MDSNKVKLYDGKSDVTVFLTRVNLVAGIKDYNGEKKAQFLASTLLPPALDVYMRLSDEDKKDYSKIEEALLKEFRKGQLNREEAIHILNDRKQQRDETPQTFAYKVVELVKLAYPSFADNVRLTIAKDYFLRGIHPDMQVALKSGTNFETSDVHALAVETVRLELAGVKSYSSTKETNVSSVNIVEGSRPEGDDIVNAVANKVMEKLQLCANSNTPTSADGNGSSQSTSGANFVGMPPYRSRGNNRRNRGRNRGDGQNRFSGQQRQQQQQQQQQQQRRCRACKAMGHIVRECPQRFCQACGQRGHDGWSDQCPNYEA